MHVKLRAIIWNSLSYWSTGHLPAHWLLIPAVILLFYFSIVLKRRHIENLAIISIIDELLKYIIDHVVDIRRTDS